MRGIDLDPATVRTNIVIFRLTSGGAMAFLERLRGEGILAVPVSQDKVRFVTHRDVSREQIDQAIERLQRLAAA